MAPPYPPVGGNFVPVIRVSAVMHAERPLYNVYDCCVFMDQSVNPANAHLTPTCTSKAVSVTKDPEGLHICAFHRAQKQSYGAQLLPL